MKVCLLILKLRFAFYIYRKFKKLKIIHFFDGLMFLLQKYYNALVIRKIVVYIEIGSPILKSFQIIRIF